MHTATYSPEDNKIRIYPAHRLDEDDYTRVRAAGFKWAPKQELFVAPMWTPDREDLAIEMCGEIDDEDKSLVERAEERAERFEEYSDNRRKDSEAAHQAVSAIADNIPLGQPILVGHHSEKRARRDAEKIENGMRRAIKMWDQSKYWKDRAAGAIRAAKYKERPDVRARRIKGLEADKRKVERARAKAVACLAFWTSEALTKEKAIAFAGSTEAGWLQLPRKEGDRQDFDGRPSAYDALTNNHPSLYAPRSLEEIIEYASSHYPRVIERCDRWIRHYENRLTYEKAMLEDQGKSELIAAKPRPKQLPICNYRMPDGVDIKNEYHRGEMMHYRQVEMTPAEYAKLYKDYKGTRIVEKTHRVRIAILHGPNYHYEWVCVFLTDSKTHPKPEAVQPKEIHSDPEKELRELWDKQGVPKEKQDALVAHVTEKAQPGESVGPFSIGEKIEAMKESLKAGVCVVSAPQLFPTPKEIAQEMVRRAEIQPCQAVLEPSAGTGNIAKEIREAAPDAHLDCIEINPNLCRVLQGKGFEVAQYDFLEVEKPFCPDSEEGWDRIVMNPPFENGTDIKHIKHALTFLKPGGRLVALCANGPRQQKELGELGEYIPLPAGSFEEQGTGVNVAMLVIEKTA